MTLETLYRYFAQSKDSQWIMQPQNAALLYQFVKNNPVKRVLEFGTGIGLSAAVVALAMKDKGETDWKIDTLEQYDKCIDIAMRMIPKELDPEDTHITIHKANPVVWKTELIPHISFSAYEEIPEGDYDLYINDGPSPFMEGESYIDLPNGTIKKLLLEKKIKPGAFIVYDGRLQSLALLERFFDQNFLLVKPNAGKSDFNVLERKDNQDVIFSDFMLDNMKALHYFDDSQDQQKKNMFSNNSETASSETVTSDTGA